MLDSSKKKNYSDAKVVTVIGQGTQVTGDIRSKGTIRIEGAVSGRISCDDTIVIHETGQVKADLIAAQIVIGGTVQGNVFAKERLEVTTKGKLVGDIASPRVSIAEGVLFEGNCVMKPASEMTLPKWAEEKETSQPQKPPQAPPRPSPAAPPASRPSTTPPRAPNP